MYSICEYGNSIFYICHRRKFCEYNLLNRKKYIHRIAILSFCIFRNNVVILDKFHNLKWATKAINIVPHDSLRGPNILRTDPHDSLRGPNILRTKNELFVIIRKGYRWRVYDLNGVLRDRSDLGHIISNDGSVILEENDGMVFIINALKCNLEDLNKNLDYIHVDDFIHNISWVCDSNRFIVANMFDDSSSILIINIKTEKRLKIQPESQFKFFDSGIHYLIGIFDDTINFYDADELTLLESRDVGLHFVAYHKKLQLLISEDFNHYIITSRFELDEFISGKNYLQDRNFCFNLVMEIILDTDLLFEQMPLEITCIELYQQILINVIQKIAIP